MGDWDDERGGGGFRNSVIGRVDWACWLAVVGLLFVTVISIVVQFPLMGVVTAIIAVLLVAFDSWVNRPSGGRARRRYDESAQYDGTGWSEVRRADSRPQQPVRQPQRQQPAPPPRQTNRPAPNFRGQQGRPNQGVPPRQQGQPGRPAPNQQPMRQGQPPRPNQGQPQPPTRVNQGQPPQRAPYRPPTPPPARGREPDYRART